MIGFGYDYFCKYVTIIEKEDFLMECLIEYSATSISGEILNHLCSFPYKWTSINGEVGNGDLSYQKLSSPYKVTSLAGE